MEGFNPFVFTEEFYKINNEIDKYLYPGYHMNLLDEAAETHTEETRKNLLEAAEKHQMFLSALNQERNENAYKILEATEKGEEETLEKYQKKQVQVERELAEYRGYVTECIREVFEEEDKRRRKIATFLGR